MVEFLYGHDDVVSQFVATLTPHCRRGFGPCKTIGIINDDGNLIGGIVYHNYDPDAQIIEISGAATSPRWLTSRTIGRMYQYAFIECGCQMIVQRTPADNERLLRQLAQGNFSFIPIPRMFGRDRDGVLCILTYEDWCNSKFSKRYKHHLHVDVDYDLFDHEEAA